eukprot:2667338-Prymnesium_polylepis.1
MEDVLSPSQIEEFAVAARSAFYEVLRANMVWQVLAEAKGEPMLDRYAEVAKRDGARCDSRFRMAAPPFSSILREGGLCAALLPALRAILGEDSEVVAVGQIVARWAISPGRRCSATTEPPPTTAAATR